MKAIVMGTGAIGATLAACAREKGAELVGAVDVDPGKVGRDAGDVLGLEPLGFAVVEDVAQIEHDDAVVLHATGSSLEAVSHQLEACMRRGLNVVSTCEELAYPWRSQPELAGRLDDAARTRGVTLVGAGVNPGFVMDFLALTATVPCWKVRSVSVTRVLDAGSRRQSFQEKVAAGASQEEFARRLAGGSFGHVGLPESAWLISDRLGLDGERLDESIEPVLMTGDGAGEQRVAGLRQSAVLLRGEDEVVRLEMAMYLGADDPRDVVEIDGDPPIRLEVQGGVPGDPATAGVILNVACRVSSAVPGLLTVDQLPLAYAGRDAA